MALAAICPTRHQTENDSGLNLGEGIQVDGMDASYPCFENGSTGAGADPTRTEAAGREWVYAERMEHW